MMPRTSQSDPIRVFWMDLATTGVPGRIGTTLAPGKVGPSVRGRPWERDLGMDLDRLAAAYQTALLISLLEDQELSTYRIPDIVSEARRRGMHVLRIPTVDLATPDPPEARIAVTMALEYARQGRNVVIHCLGGCGRAGTLAACCAVGLGLNPQAAIRTIRKTNPDAIENLRQEEFIHTFAETWPRQGKIG